MIWYITVEAEGTDIPPLLNVIRFVYVLIAIRSSVAGVIFSQGGGR